MNKKFVSLSLLTLGFCSFAFAAEYVSPEVGFKKYAAPTKEMKVSEMDEHYKVEKGVEASRDIASKEESDREPSSVTTKSPKKYEEPESKEAPSDAPKPWLFRNQHERTGH